MNINAVTKQQLKIMQNAYEQEYEKQKLKINAQLEQMEQERNKRQRIIEEHRTIITTFLNPTLIQKQQVFDVLINTYEIPLDSGDFNIVLANLRKLYDNGEKLCYDTIIFLLTTLFVGQHKTLFTTILVAIGSDYDLYKLCWLINTGGTMIRNVNGKLTHVYDPKQFSFATKEKELRIVYLSTNKLSHQITNVYLDLYNYRHFDLDQYPINNKMKLYILKKSPQD